MLTRVGAVDDVADAMSSFEVEMAETAAILSAASGESFVLLDEIGRGTSVVDGIGIACAVAQALVDGPDPPRTLFVSIIMSSMFLLRCTRISRQWLCKSSTVVNGDQLRRTG